MIGNDYNENEERQNKPGSPIGILLTLTILFLPAVLFGSIFWAMLRIWKQRLSVIFSASVLSSVLFILFGTLSSASEKAQTALSNIGDFRDNWTLFIPILVMINGILGSIGGFASAWWGIRQMKMNPHNLEIEGNWMYHFKYRRTPLQVLRLKRRIQGLKNGSYVDSDRAPIGIDETNEGDLVAFRYNTEAVKHTLISGASGSGKTITMLSLILADIQNQLPTIVIDFKRSPELASKIAAWSSENDCEFYHFINGPRERYDVKNSPGQAFYDPLSGGSSTSKADMVLGMREYDTASAVYKANMQQLLQVLFAMLKYADKKKAPNIDWNSGGIYQLASAVKDANFTQLVAACEGTPIEKEAQDVDIASRQKSSGIRHAMEELQGQMRTIISTEYGPWLKTSPNDRNIDLLKLSEKKGSVVLFSLNSDSEPEFAKYIGSMILADLTAVSAKRRNLGLKNQVDVYVDEFQAVNPSSVTSLLEKSRESRMAMTLAQQSFAQIISSAPSNGEAYLDGIIDTCSNFFIHAGSALPSAERLSSILGKKWVTTYRVANKNSGFFFSLNFSNKRISTVQTGQEEKWVFEPREFMSLSSPDKTNGYKSTAVMINKTSSDDKFEGSSGPVARRVWMIPNDKVIGSYYTPTFSDDEDELTAVKEKEKPQPQEEYKYNIPKEESISSLLGNHSIYEEESNDFDSYQEEYVEQENPYSSQRNDEEYEDGDFSWEKVEDENLDKELQEISEIDISKKVSAQKRSYRSDSIDDLFSKAPKNLQQNPKKKSRLHIDNKPKQSTSSKVEEIDDDLPDIEF